MARDPCRLCLPCGLLCVLLHLSIAYTEPSSRTPPLLFCDWPCRFLTCSWHNSTYIVPCSSGPDVCNMLCDTTSTSSHFKCAVALSHSWNYWDVDNAVDMGMTHPIMHLVDTAVTSGLCMLVDGPLTTCSAFPPSLLQGGRGV